MVQLPFCARDDETALSVFPGIDQRTLLLERGGALAGLASATGNTAAPTGCGFIPPPPPGNQPPPPPPRYRARCGLEPPHTSNSHLSTTSPSYTADPGHRRTGLQTAALTPRSVSVLSSVHSQQANRPTTRRSRHVLAPAGLLRRMDCRTRSERVHRICLPWGEGGASTHIPTSRLHTKAHSTSQRSGKH